MFQKSNFNIVSKEPLQATVRADAAHHHAHLFMDAKIKGYSQWFSRKLNNIVDALFLGLAAEWQRPHLNTLSPLPTTDADAF